MIALTAAVLGVVAGLLASTWWRQLTVRRRMRDRIRWYSMR